MRNTLYYGDNLEILRRHIPHEPPTNVSFKRAEKARNANQEKSLLES